MKAPLGHYHRVESCTERCFTGPAYGAKHENQRAHGGVCYLERCRCGATRMVNCNAGDREVGSWYYPDDAPG